MNSKETCISIKKIEKKYNPKIYINNLDFWPLLRLAIVKELISSNKFNSQKKKKKYSFIYLIFVMLNRMVSYFFIKKDIKDKKYLFISRTSYLHKDKKNNIFIDRIFDHIFQKKNISNYTTKIYLSEKIKINNLKFKGNLLFPFLTFLSNKNYGTTLETEKIIRKIAKEASINPNKLIKIFKLDLLTFNNWYNLGLKLFSNNTNIKKIFIACWYNPDAVGLICAARNKGILIYDMQHGFQGKYQAHYTDWSLIKKEGSKLLPNFFWCWNNITKKNILNTSKSRKDNIPIVLGNDYFKYYKKNYLIKKNYYNKKIILFSMQPLTDRNNILIPKFIKKYLSSIDFKDNLFIFRIHPNDKSSKKELFDFVKKHKKHKQIIIDLSENNFLDAVEGCTHHITAFSSTAIEAAYLNKKSSVFGEDSKLLYNEYIKSNYLQYLKGDYLNFIKWINLKNKKKRNFVNNQLFYAKPTYDKIFKYTK